MKAENRRTEGFDRRVETNLAPFGPEADRTPGAGVVKALDRLRNAGLKDHLGTLDRVRADVVDHEHPAAVARDPVQADRRRIACVEDAAGKPSARQQADDLDQLALARFVEIPEVAEVV